MPLHLVQNDITQMKTEAIVNAANSALAQGGGVCGAIFDAAGREEMTAACQAIGHCPVGGAVLTPGFSLAAKYVIHAVGPVWTGGAQEEEKLLRSCYTSALQLAEQRGIGSIAFPLISSGIYGYPKKQALRIALDTITSFLMEHEIEVYLVVFDRDAVALGDALVERMERYADTVEQAERERRCRRDWERARQLQEQQLCYAKPVLFEKHPVAKPEEIFVAQETMPLPSCAQKNDVDCSLSMDWTAFEPEIGETFSEQLLRRIDERGMTDVETYKRANIDRRLFSKIRSRKDYTPSRRTALALAVALRLTVKETQELLESAGYALSGANRTDVIVRFFIESGDYDVFHINEALFYYGEPLLGA